MRSKISLKRLESKLRSITDNPRLTICGKSDTYPRYVISNGQWAVNGVEVFTGETLAPLEFESLGRLERWFQELGTNDNTYSRLEKF